MRQQQLEDALRTIKDSIQAGQDAPVVSGTGVLLDLIKDTCEEALCPTGGKVDARVSNTLAARRPGSSPGSGTTPPKRIASHRTAVATFEVLLQMKKLDEALERLRTIKQEDGSGYMQ